MAEHNSDAGGIAKNANTLRNSRTRPGSLRGESWITIQTYQAQQLVIGRKGSDEKYPIIGLTRFGSLASIPYVCSRLDDPYADWWLVRIEESLEHSHAQMNALCQNVQHLITMHPGIHISIAKSINPIRVPLKFSNPYAHMAARLLVQFDTFVRMLSTARYHALLNPDDYEKLLNIGGRAVRRALCSALGYKNQSTNRSDIKANNARAQKARLLMGDIPVAILNRRKRAKHAPEIRSAVTSGTRNSSGQSPFGNRGLALQRSAPASANDGNKKSV